MDQRLSLLAEFFIYALISDNNLDYMRCGKKLKRGRTGKQRPYNAIAVRIEEYFEGVTITNRFDKDSSDIAKRYWNCQQNFL